MFGARVTATKRGRSAASPPALIYDNHSAHYRNAGYCGAGCNAGIENPPGGNAYDLGASYTSQTKYYAYDLHRSHLAERIATNHPSADLLTNQNFTSNLMKTILLSLLAITFASQTRAADSVISSTAQLAAERSAVANASQAAKRDDAATAEQFLLSVNRARPESASWHLESAQRLIQLAHDVPREGRTRVIPAFVESALQHLARADLLATNARQKAAIRSFTGLVYERFRGDHPAALASYRAAAALAPDNVLAVRAAERLQRTTDNLTARAHK